MKYVGVSTPAWTILGRKEEKAAPVEDPPGDLAIVDSDLKSKKHLYPSQPSIKWVKPNPPPERSQPEEEVVHSKSPKKVASPKKQRRKKNNEPKPDRFKTINPSVGPGPGTYQADMNKKIDQSMPNFSFGYRFDSMGGKISEKLENGDPAPITGLYYPLYKHREHQKSAIFTHSEKEKKYPLIVKGKELPVPEPGPGPTTYTIKELPGSDTSKKGTFGSVKPIKTQRKKSKNPKEDSSTQDSEMHYYNVVQHTIGYKAQKIKEQYDELNKNRAPLSMEKKIPVSEDGNNLTAAAVPIMNSKYNPGTSGPHWKFGEGKRPNLNFSSQTKLGPGEYYNMHHSKVPRDKFPLVKSSSMNKNFKRVGNLNSSPGPDRYFDEPSEDHKERMENSAARKGVMPPVGYSFRGKFEQHGFKDKYRMPGPGYNHDNIEMFTKMGQPGQGVTIGNGLRIPRAREENQKTRADTGTILGPGSYEIDRDITNGGIGIRFPKAERKPMVNGTDPDIEIGPNHYNLKPVIPDLQYHEMIKMSQSSPFNMNF